jgi:hypothetical protein
MYINILVIFFYKRFEKDPLAKNKFIHIYRTYIKKGKDRDSYVERIKLEFPYLTRL